MATKLSKVTGPGPDGTLSDWLAYISTQHAQEIALGLERSQRVAVLMDLLPLAPRNLIVAGTNGKGSTVRFAESLLLAQGYSVGATLSPHMHRYNERVRINGVEATNAQLVAAFVAVERGRGEIPLTYYEYSILAAFWLFKQAAVEVCVLEVGLGGRLDVTNIVACEVAVVTSIGYDHQNFLGDTLDEIGAEKAAVCRADAQLLLGGDMPASVTSLAEAKGAKLSRFGEDFWYRRTATDWAVHLQDQSDPRSATHPAVAMRNAALATAAVARLTRVPTSGELNKASKTCRHPGRFELLRWEGRRLVLDVAHNPASALFLARQLQAKYPATSGRQMVACVGFLADKDATAIVRAVAGLFAHWVVVPTTGARGLSADDALTRVLEASSSAEGAAPTIVACKDVVSGMIEALAHAGKADIIVAFGSFQQVQLVREMVFPNERGTA